MKIPKKNILSCHHPELESVLCTRRSTQWHRIASSSGQTGREVKVVFFPKKSHEVVGNSMTFLWFQIQMETRHVVTSTVLVNFHPVISWHNGNATPDPPKRHLFVATEIEVESLLSPRDLHGIADGCEGRDRSIPGMPPVQAAERRFCSYFSGWPEK